MNIESSMKGFNRAFARHKQRQANQQQTSVESNKPACIKPVLASSPVFDLELYRVDIISKAITHIMNNKQKEINK